MRSGRSGLSDEISALQSQVLQSVRRMECMMAVLGLDTSQASLDYTALWSDLQSDVRDLQLRETLRSRVEHSHWSRSVEILSSDWLNLYMLSMP